MTHQPKYVLIYNYSHYAIVNDDANFIVGRVYWDAQNKLFRVEADLEDDYCCPHVGVVATLAEAIPALANFYEKNPPQWKIEKLAVWRKEAQYGSLRVERDVAGYWCAYRDDYPMLRGAKPAEFRTDDEARSAADAHLLDLYPGHEPLKDGLSWQANPEIDWRSDPQYVKDRAFKERMTMERVGLLQAAKATLDKNASALQRRAISSRVGRTNDLVKDSIIHELGLLGLG
jgi:hypothetical protein